MVNAIQACLIEMISKSSSHLSDCHNIRETIYSLMEIIFLPSLYSFLPEKRISQIFQVDKHFTICIHSDLPCSVASWSQLKNQSVYWFVQSLWVVNHCDNSRLTKGLFSQVKVWVKTIKGLTHLLCFSLLIHPNPFVFPCRLFHLQFSCQFQISFWVLRMEGVILPLLKNLWTDALRSIEQYQGPFSCLYLLLNCSTYRGGLGLLKVLSQEMEEEYFIVRWWQSLDEAAAPWATHWRNQKFSFLFFLSEASKLTPLKC